MCGICGIWDFKGNNVSEDLIKSMYALVHRGPDGAGVLVDRKILYGSLIDLSPPSGSFGMGHVLLSIIGGLQPLSNERGDLWVIHNGEIYNYLDLRKWLKMRGHKIFTDSDSEILVHLFEEDKLDLIKGDYAFAIYSISNDELYLYRDFPGIRPLFYCIKSRKFAFASERKGLRHICDDIKEVKPGEKITVASDGITKEQHTYPTVMESSNIRDEHEAVKQLRDLLYESAELMAYEPSSMLFSGGIDSTILSYILRDLDVDIILFSVGIEGSKDWVNSLEAAQFISLPHVPIPLNERIIESVLEDVIYAIEDYDPMKVAIAVPIYVVTRKIREEKFRVAFSGQGADELFGGYARYLRSSNPSEEMMNDVKMLYLRNLDRDDHVSMANSVEMRYPYLYERIISFALNLPMEFKIRDSIRKYILRRLASNLSFPKKLAFREKKAIQYGSGVQKILRKLAKREKKTVREYFKSIYDGLYS
ncbi:MAG: asparagine synthetase B family protein [Candidatus Njordarchaeia archaeon]